MNNKWIYIMEKKADVEFLIRCEFGALSIARRKFFLLNLFPLMHSFS